MTEQPQNAIINLPVTGMMCNGCVAAVTAALESVAGVHHADVSLEKKEAVITYDPAQTTKDEMKKAVENAGYSVVI